LLFKVSGMRFF